MKQGFAAGLVAAIALGMGGAAMAEEIVSVGTGDVTGVYYPAGGAICRLVNVGRKEHGIRCFVESTGGSVENIAALRSGDLDFGVVQSDLQYDALNGRGAFAGDPVADLRTVFAIHPEPFTLVVREGSGIGGFGDIVGKRVNIGNPGSGQRATMELVMDAFGIGTDDLLEATEFTGSEMSQELCDNRIDAMVYTVGHPAAAIKDAAGDCAVRLVEVTGEPVDRLVAENPYFRHAVIPGGLYAGNDRDVETFGTVATLVTRADTPEAVVHRTALSVLGNLDEFRDLHPAFWTLRADGMVSEGYSAPLHPGAERAFRELGLIE
ncbi:TAXI family TRAP transporter solute-binding subunit [Tropicimonas sp.]|uniref:TAXI family TRAP transporter solute-binding subunit n=1 Tax=Tropicimonas sp. TaxID=2067044 RepID=UPI003A880E88